LCGETAMAAALMARRISGSGTLGMSVQSQ